METVEVLYIIVGACIVVITVTFVWLANEAMRLTRSLRRSSEDVEFMTKEFKEKVLMVSEALDRAGTAATNIISLVEDAIEGIKEKREQLANSIGLVTGVGEYFRNKNHKEPAREKPEPKEAKPEPIEKPKKMESKEDKIEEAKTDKELEKAVEEIKNPDKVKEEVIEKTDKPDKKK